MLDMPVFDTHLHIWNPGNLRYPWLDDIPKLNHPYLPADYSKTSAGLSIEKMVFVQCECDGSQFMDEVRWAATQTEKDPRIKGIVSWASLEKGEASRDDLERLSENSLVKGIRRIIQFEKDVEFCLRAPFVKGVQLLADFDMHFEICIKGDKQFSNTLELVRSCPNVRFILNHIGKPFIKEKIMAPWASHLKTLAELPNTGCKMSGLVNEADWDDWTPADLKPYIEQVIDSFGFDRVMFGGDWPVCTLASTYRRWIDTLWDALTGCSTDERRKLFQTNAEQFYNV